jgi:hypothetical protein
MDRDEQIRAADFQKVAALYSRFEEAIPWSAFAPVLSLPGIGQRATPCSI